mmetsp:Transcript_15964/g.36275  ORF Transcript_15964/g.36275 Transcript_15964/m.36275 type:complete len:498 (+) Transcript_15964:709-2202(+)
MWAMRSSILKPLQQPKGFLANSTVQKQSTACPASAARRWQRSHSRGCRAATRTWKICVTRSSWRNSTTGRIGSRISWMTMARKFHSRRPLEVTKSEAKKPATPTYIPPTTPTGFMRPPPNFPAMPMFPPPVSIPPAPAATFASTLPGASKDTLLMLKGVPTQYTREKLASTLKSKYGAAFDFLFLPGDAKGEGNRGHAFVNFLKKETAEQFKEDFSGKPLQDCFETDEEEKTCDVAIARMDSLEKSIQRAQNGSAQQDRLPVLFGEDGEEKPFPLLGETGTKDETEPKAKARPKDRKGSKDVTPPGAPKGYPFAPGYFGGYPGYPGMPGYNPAVYHAYAQLAAAQNAQAIQVAQMQAQAAARAQVGGKGGKGAAGVFPSVLDPLAAAVNHKEDEELTEDSKAQLRHQVEYYFSTDNLCKDLFLREHMEPEGWVSLHLIRTFPRVSKFSVSSKKLMEACSASETLEIDADAEKIRLANADERSKWAQPQVAPSKKSAA